MLSVLKFIKQFEGLFKGQPQPDQFDPRMKAIRDRVAKSALFNEADYMELHYDLRAAKLINRNFSPIDHYVQYGLGENRTAIRGISLAKLLGEVEQRFEQESKLYLERFELAQKNKKRLGKNIAVYYHSAGNYYMYPIALCLQQAFLAAGVNCRLANEKGGVGRSDEIPIIVAPHEFFALDIPRAFKEARFISKSILFTTEQIFLPWFQSSLPQIYAARGVIDINFQTSLVLRDCGIRSAHVIPPIGSDFHRLASRYLKQGDMRVWEFLPPGRKYAKLGLPFNKRPLDIFFAGYQTSDRDKFFELNREFFRNKKCCFLYRSQPPRPEPPSNLPLEEFGRNLAITSLSKVVLNLHRHPIGYFEWERMVVQGAFSGAVPVSTTCLRSPFFVSGVNYLDTNTRNVDKILRWLFDSVEGKRRAAGIQHANEMLLAKSLTPVRVGRFLSTVVQNFITSRRDG